MSKLLTYLALGAATGLVVGAATHTAIERSESGSGKPLLPSSIRAAAAGLLPLALAYVQDNLHELLGNVHDASPATGAAPASDTAQAMSASATGPVDSGAEPVATDVTANPPAPQHPMGAGYAPTPA